MESLDHAKSNPKMACLRRLIFYFRRAAMRKAGQCKPDMRDPEKTGSKSASGIYLGAMSLYN
jgi:hypothetical protein